MHEKKRRSMMICPCQRMRRKEIVEPAPEGTRRTERPLTRRPMEAAEEMVSAATAHRGNPGGHVLFDSEEGRTRARSLPHLAVQGTTQRPRGHRVGGWRRSRVPGGRTSALHPRRPPSSSPGSSARRVAKRFISKAMRFTILASLFNQWLLRSGSRFGTACALAIGTRAFPAFDTLGQSRILFLRRPLALVDLVRFYLAFVPAFLTSNWMLLAYFLSPVAVERIEDVTARRRVHEARARPWPPPRGRGALR